MSRLNFDLTDIEISGIDYTDSPDFVDAFISSAYCLKLNRELTDNELDIINEDTDFVYNCVLERIY